MVVVEKGPLTLQLNTASIQTPELKFERTQETQVNTGPKAGQRWAIENVYFNFPGAEKSPNASVSETIEFELEISMFIGGVEVAKQKFLEVAARNEETTVFHAVGSLEPFVPAQAFAGQAITFKVRVATTNTLAFMFGGVGNLVLTYSLFYDNIKPL